MFAVSVAACSSGDDQAASEVPVVQLGAPGETNRVLSSDEVAEIEAPGYTAADVAFVQAMIGHHRQGLEMTALVGERAEGDDVVKLAERMTLSQESEIVQHEAWLTDRDQPLPDAAGHEHHHDMAGMLTPEQLDHLASATGQDFDELFLQYMIRHHEGAVVMVEELITSGAGGQEPQVMQLAQHVESDQTIEISRMKSMLAERASG